MRRKRLDAELGNCLATFGCAKREQRMEEVRSYEGIRRDYNYEKVGIISLAVQRNDVRSLWGHDYAYTSVVGDGLARLVVRTSSRGIK